MKYSDQLKGYQGDLSLSVKEALEEIKIHFSFETINILQYDKFHIAIPVVFKVSLPIRGPVGNIDIRAEEPCLIKISIENYPYEIPSILSDRDDFPGTFLGHMYVKGEKEKTGPFCLVRNDPHEWFADKRLIDLLIVAGEWFFKACTGRLNEDGNEYDPTRLENVVGYHGYKYNLLHELVLSDSRFDKNYPFAVLLSCSYKNRDGYIYKSVGPVHFIELDQARELIKKLIDVGTKEESVMPFLSILVWRDDNLIEGEYITDLPKNYRELKEYFKSHGININQIIDVYIRYKLKFIKNIPIIHAIKRPKKMIGFDGQYDFRNFKLNADGFKEGQHSPDATVGNQSHIEAFSKELAIKLTGEDRNARTLYVGGGSLGSKLFMHDVRTGKLFMGDIDHDDFLQHNLVRNALLNKHIGLNKSDALIGEAKDFFPLDKTDGFQSYPYRIHHLEDKELLKYNWLVDSTASENVQNWIVNKVLPKELNISRCELADSGKLGLLYIEGSERNPRLDDLVNITYFKAMNNPYLKSWRKHDMESEKQNLSIGLGCSSPTTIMADDTISFHASIFSKLLYNETDRKIIKANGLLFRSIFDPGGIPGAKTEFEIIKPFDIYECQANSGWQMRFAPGLKNQLFTLCKSKGRIETGGVLIGVSNSKTKTIHIFHIVTEPQDSKGTCVGFIRGTKGLPEYVDKVKKWTGQVIGYVGEWHTHPIDLEKLSQRDFETVRELQVLNRRIPIPTLALIVTNTKILPFVFD